MIVLLMACSANLQFDTDVVPARPTYDADVAPLLAEHCVRCHQQGGVMDHGVDLSSYEAARGAAVRSVCTSVGDDVVAAYGEHLIPLAGDSDQGPCEPWTVFSMPPGASVHFTVAEQVTFAEWLAQGAPR